MLSVVINNTLFTFSSILSLPHISCCLATSLTTCSSLLSLLAFLPSPPTLPEECAHCAPPSIRLVIGRSGAVGDDCVGLGSFPCSDYPGLLGGNGPLPLGPSPPPLPRPPLHTSPLSSCISFPFSQCSYCTPPFLPDLVTSPLPSLLHSSDQHE